jgi:hypothetical protein
MDDGKLPGEMTLDGIAKRLDAIDARLGGLDAKVGGLEVEMRSGFKRVDEKLNEAKIRDEELHGLLKFSLEAREGLRESMEQRFDVMGNKHDQEIDLLKDVLRHTASRANG